MKLIIPKPINYETSIHSDARFCTPQYNNPDVILTHKHKQLCRANGHVCATTIVSMKRCLSANLFIPVHAPLLVNFHINYQGTHSSPVAIRHVMGLRPLQCLFSRPEDTHEFLSMLFCRFYDIFTKGLSEWGLDQDYPSRVVFPHAVHDL